MKYIENTYFIVLESNNKKSSEYVYLNGIYKPRKCLNNKNIGSLLGFSNNKNIFAFEILEKSVLKINEKINGRLDIKFSNYSRKPRKNQSQVFIIIDSDTDYGKFIIENSDYIKNNLKNKLNIDNELLINFLIPSTNSCFEEFIYYHFEVNKKFDKKTSINFIKKNFWGENKKNGSKSIKGKNIEQIFRVCFYSKDQTIKTIKLLMHNCKKYNSNYISFFNTTKIKW